MKDPKPDSEEWWLRLDVRNALRKAIESVRNPNQNAVQGSSRKMK